MTHPIPREAFDDRLAFVGTSGSGKTYASLGALAGLLKMPGARMVGIDALGVMWGLRLKADGKTRSGFDIVIFGGPHGDLPITEQTGKVIGETVATMRESCIIDLSEMGSDAAERRFMLPFLSALYRNLRKDLTHLIFDEADMWAPQMILDKEGDAMKLLGMMKTIVRRGRVKGFIPWLITQRPAELSKSVLSMMDGVVAMGMTGAADRKAVGEWIKGQADAKTGKEILESLPGKQIGEGVVWIPRRKILVPAARFPENKTFDSSRAPKRGEKRRMIDMPPLDLSKLQERMAAVVEEVKANDPAELKKQIAMLRGEVAKAQKAVPAASAKDATAALRDREAAFAAGKKEGRGEGYLQGWSDGEQSGFVRGVNAMDKEAIHAFEQREVPSYEPSVPPKKIPESGGNYAKPMHAPVQSGAQNITQNITAPPVAPLKRAPVEVSGSGAAALTGPQIALMRSLAWWAAMGHISPSRAQVAAVAGWKVKGSNLRNRLAELSTLGLVEYPQKGFISLTAEGVATAPEPDLDHSLHDNIRAMLTAPQGKLFDALLDNAVPLDRKTLAERVEWEPSGSNMRNRLAELSALEIVTYPSRGIVALQDWVTA